MELDIIARRVLSGKSMVEEMGKFDWVNFEKMVGDIFRQNDFRLRNNFRFRTNRKYENDIIAVKGNLVFCVDCKRWSNGREKKSGLSKSAKQQEERTRELEKFFKSNPIARDMMKIRNQHFVPMLVTLHQERILKEGKTFIVPVEKLNSFLLECECII